MPSAGSGVSAAATGGGGGGAGGGGGGGAGGSGAARDVAEMPDDVVRPDGRVPAIDQQRVHFRHRREGTFVDIDRTMVAEMGVAGEEDRHVQYSTRACGSSAAIRSAKKSRSIRIVAAS